MHEDRIQDRKVVPDPITDEQPTSAKNLLLEMKDNLTLRKALAWTLKQNILFRSDTLYPPKANTLARARIHTESTAKVVRLDVASGTTMVQTRVRTTLHENRNSKMCSAAVVSHVNIGACIRQIFTFMCFGRERCMRAYQRTAGI